MCTALDTAPKREDENDPGEFAIGMRDGPALPPFATPLAQASFANAPDVTIKGLVEWAFANAGKRLSRPFQPGFARELVLKYSPSTTASMTIKENPTWQ